MYNQESQASNQHLSSRTRLKKFIAPSIVALISAFVSPLSAIGQSLEPVQIPQIPSPTATLDLNLESSSKAVVAAWTAPDPNAIMVAIHGFGLHKLAFKKLAEQMQKDKISTYSMDVRGFGGWTQSTVGEHVDFRRTLEDLDTLIRTIRGECPDKPIFVMGESMGGAIALAYAAAHPSSINGVISAVPSNERFHSMRTNARIAAQYIFSGGRKINLDKILVKQVSNNNVLRATWKNDADAKLRVTLGELTSFNGFMKATSRIVKQVDDVPVLVVQGHNDRLVIPEGTKKLFDNLATTDKQYLLVQNAEHLILEEGQFDESVLQKLEQWLTSHEKQALVASR